MYTKLAYMLSNLKVTVLPQVKQVSQQGDIFPVWEEPLGTEGKHYPTASNYFYILYLKPLSLVIFLLLHMP